MINLHLNSTVGILLLAEGLAAEDLESAERREGQNTWSRHRRSNPLIHAQVSTTSGGGRGRSLDRPDQKTLWFTIKISHVDGWHGLTPALHDP